MMMFGGFVLMCFCCGGGVWYKKKKKKREQEAGGAPTGGNGPAQYIVDQVAGPSGLGFRQSPDINDRCSDNPSVAIGTRVTAISQTQDWIEVEGQRWLPIRGAGVEFLKPVQGNSKEERKAEKQAKKAAKKAAKTGGGMMMEPVMPLSTASGVQFNQTVGGAGGFGTQQMQNPVAFQQPQYGVPQQQQQQQPVQPYGVPQQQQPVQPPYGVPQQQPAVAPAASAPATAAPGPPPTAEAFLQKINLSMYLPALQELGISSADDMLDLQEADLVDLGMKPM